MDFKVNNAFAPPKFVPTETKIIKPPKKDTLSPLTTDDFIRATSFEYKNEVQKHIERHEQALKASLTHSSPEPSLLRRMIRKIFT